MEEKSVILIFAKIPRENNVKTRLIEGVITSKDALALYTSFFLDSLSQASKSKVDHIILSLTDNGSFSSNQISQFDFFKNIKIDKIQKEFHIQPEGTFGDRMKSAIQYVISKGYKKIIVLGADSPHIQPNLLDNSLLLLDHNQIVLGPSPEGGVYLIGLHNVDSLNGFENIFEGVELLNFTKFAKASEYQVMFLPELTDIDTQSDLVSLIAWITSVTLLHDQAKKFPISIPSNTVKTINSLGLSIRVNDSNNREKQIIKA